MSDELLERLDAGPTQFTHWSAACYSDAAARIRTQAQEIATLHAAIDTRNKREWALIHENTAQAARIAELEKALEHTLARMGEWANQGACPICLVATCADFRRQLAAFRDPQEEVTPIKTPPDKAEIERWRHLLRNYAVAVKSSTVIAWLDALELRVETVEQQLGVAERERENWHDMVLESTEAALAEAKSKAVDAACKPWEFCVGDPPEWESPLQNVWQAAIVWCQELIAKRYHIAAYDSEGATETLEGDTMYGFASIIEQIVELRLTAERAAREAAEEDAQRRENDLRYSYQVACERQEAAERVLCGLTPGGSEYANDPKACADYVRRVRTDQHETILKFKRERDAAADLAREDTAILDWLDANPRAIVRSGKQHIRPLIREAMAARKGEEPHTDHPARHWDRTCPACNPVAAQHGPKWLPCAICGQPNTPEHHAEHGR